MNWGEIYAHLIACYGWTWDYIADNIDLVRLKSLYDYQEQYPPLHQLAAAYMGVERKATASNNNNNNDQTVEVDDDQFLSMNGMPQSPYESGVRMQ